MSKLEKEDIEEIPIDLPEPKYRSIAKELVGKWGYEEEYWWRPIELALTQAFFDGQKIIIDSFFKNK